MQFGTCFFCSRNKLNFFHPCQPLNMTSSYTHYPTDAPCVWGVLFYASWGRENSIFTGRIVLHSLKAFYKKFLLFGNTQGCSAGPSRIVMIRSVFLATGKTIKTK